MMKKILLILVIISIVTLVGYSGYREIMRKESLRKNYEITNCNIKGWYLGGVRNHRYVVIKNTFSWKGKKFEGENEYEKEHLSLAFFHKQLQGKVLKVAIDSTDPTNSKLLLYPMDYWYFGLKYPDSMQWASDYLYQPWMYP